MKYICDPCFETFKQITQFLWHLQDIHKITISGCDGFYYTDEGGNTSFKNRAGSKYYCEGCKKELKSIIMLITHLGKEHNLHCGYVRGIIKKIGFLDGIGK